jgi:hypothetical protein
MAKRKPGVQGHLESAIKKYASGNPFKLTEAEANALFQAKERELAGDPQAKRPFESAEASGATFEEILAAAANGPSYLDKLEDRMRRGEVTERSAAVLNVFKDVVNLTASRGQIKRSDRALARLRRPGLPTPLREDQALNNAISGAQAGTLNAARVVEPIRQELDNQYAADQAVARDISGGQAATYGGLSQLSSLRKRRGLNSLAPEIDAIRAREQARLDNLLQQRAQQRQASWDQQFRNAYMNREAYNMDLAAAADLGRVGRENLYGTLNNLAPSIATLAGYGYGTRINIPNIRLPRFRRYTGNQVVDEFNDRVDGNLTGYNPPYRPIDSGIPYGGDYR